MFDVDLFMSMSFMHNAWGVAQRTLHDHILFTVFTCFHHGKFLNCRKLSTKTLLQSTRIEVRVGLMGFWLPPFEFRRIRSIPQTLSIPTSQAMEWWDPSPCSWRANSAAAKIKGSLANFVSAGSSQRIQGLAVGTTGVDIRTSPNRFDIYIYGAIASTNISLAFLGCTECSSRSHTTCCFGNWFIPMRTVLFSLPTMLLMLKWQPRQADKRADFDSLISVIVRASFIHNSMQLANWIYTCIMISINTWTYSM